MNEMDITLVWILGVFIIGTAGGYFIGKYEERRNVIEFIREINIGDLMALLTEEIELQTESAEEEK